MTGVAGPFFAAVALLGAAGLVKLLRPLSTARALRGAGLPGTPLIGRMLGLGEVVVALSALLVGGRISATLVAVCYLGFAGFTARLLLLAGGTSCGCFGDHDAPATSVHVALNLTAATTAALAAGWPPGSLRAFLGDQPWAGLPFLALTLLLAWLAYVTLTLLPELRAASGRHDVDPGRPDRAGGHR